uniref:ATP-grasp domain-containing protein n=1 Tax=Amphiprion ocellaris TaxID=80972 RepID=A0AAQ5X9B1_AMPOC
AGKGVIVARDQDEACRAVMDIMKDRAFGSAGEEVVVEELLEGEEVSCLCFSDGHSVAPMPPAQDHKRLQDGDQGPNTGGMGAYCPTPQVSQELLQQIRESVLQKTVDGMREEGTPYVGVLYAGLMLTNQGPKVLEFNCRFGDPECQVLLPLLQSDLYEAILNTMSGKLASSAPVWHQDSSAVTVVMASAGYSGSYQKGVQITGTLQTNVEMIKPLVKAASRPGCSAELGGFAGLFDLKAAGFGTDGVGTKLKIVQACRQLDGLGQDLVAMCVNDVLAQAVEPLFFLRDFTCIRLDIDVAASVVSGIAKACEKAGCALLGNDYLSHVICSICLCH